MSLREVTHDLATLAIAIAQASRGASLREALAHLQAEFLLQGIDLHRRKCSYFLVGVVEIPFKGRIVNLDR